MSDSPSQPSSAPRSTEIVCHRGANQYAPENTYASAQICLDWGVDTVEVDVNTSADGVMYLFHGPLLEWTTDGAGFFHELTAEQIDQLDVGSWFDPAFAGQRAPRLEPFLRWIKGRAKLFLDVKHADLTALIDLIRRLGMVNDVFFWFWEAAQARTFRQLAPDLALKINASTVDEVIRAHEEYQAEIVEVEFEQMSQPILDACRERAIKLMVYQRTDDAGAYRQILDWGVDLINLNHADAFLALAAAHRRTLPPQQPLAICLDCGDTLVDESTEVKDGEISLRAELIPGAGQLVREIKRRGYPLALVADGPTATFINNLAPYELYDLFDVYAISEQVGVEKPHPAIFHHALKQLGIARVDYDRVLMVGNNLERDIKGANRLGMRSVWLDWAPRRSKVPADASEQPLFTIRTPLELLDLM